MFCPVESGILKKDSLPTKAFSLNNIIMMRTICCAPEKNLYWKYLQDLQDCKCCVVSKVERWKSLISQMEIKPSKYHIIFNKPIIEPVPAVLEEPIKSLGCSSDVNLQQASTTNKGGYNHWPQAYQQYCSPRKERATAQIGDTRVSAALSLWPITLFEVARSQVSKLGVFDLI